MWEGNYGLSQIGSHGTVGQSVGRNQLVEQSESINRKAASKKRRKECISGDW